MDKVTVLFVENLALADLMISLLFYTPMLATIPSGRWIFGAATCWFTGFFSSHVPFLAEILLIMSISVYRVWVLKKPPAVRKRINVGYVKITIAVIWAITLVPVTYWVASKAKAFFFGAGLICWSTNHKPTSPTYQSTRIFSVFYVALPIITVFISNMRMMYIIVQHTVKAGQPLNRHLRTLLTVILICWALLVSYLPVFVLILLKSAGRRVPTWFTLFQIHVRGVHVVVNPCIYVATNARFRGFVSRLVRTERYLLTLQTLVSPRLVRETVSSQERLRGEG
jgi:hypothetical protein